MMRKDDVPNFCGSKAFKGTTYGPAEFLSKRGKRSRMMNDEELQKYDKKVKATKGFDVDGCTGCMPGRISPISPVSREWEIAVEVAKCVCDDALNLSAPSMKFVALMKANIQPVEGAMYYLTFDAVDSTDDVRKTYQTKVWMKPGIRLFCQYFKEFKKSQKAGKLGRGKKQVASRASARDRKHGNLSLKGKLGRGKKQVASRASARDREHGNLSLKGSSSVDKCAGQSVGNPGLIRQPRPGELRAIGFSILLDDLRRSNSSLRYASARSAASKEWRSLSDDEKQPYVIRAELKFKGKHGMIKD